MDPHIDNQKLPTPQLRGAICKLGHTNNSLRAETYPGRCVTVRRGNSSTTEADRFKNRQQEAELLKYDAKFLRSSACYCSQLFIELLRLPFSESQSWCVRVRPRLKGSEIRKQ